MLNLDIQQKLTAIALEQAYPLVFATVSGAHLYGFGQEKGELPAADLTFHGLEFNRLLAELEQARDRSHLAQKPTAEPAMHDLLLRVRLGQPCDLALSPIPPFHRGKCLRLRGLSTYGFFSRCAKATGGDGTALGAGLGRVWGESGASLGRSPYPA
jgi:hypothetical protein